MSMMLLKTLLLLISVVFAKYSQFSQSESTFFISRFQEGK